MNEIEKLNNEALALFSKEDIETLVKFEELKARVEMAKSQRNEKLINLFEAAGVKKFEGNGIRITYVAPHQQTRVDGDKLKKEGIYDAYTKQVDVKASVKVEVLYED